MGVLETVFRTRKFDLDDDVLMEFDDYFDKKSRNYNSFSLDEEDFISLQNFVEEIKSIDSNSVVYVSTQTWSSLSRIPTAISSETPTASS